jgi:hypothetical protein
MERETGVEPATSTLARLHSTTELLPLAVTTEPLSRSPTLNVKCVSALKRGVLEMFIYSLVGL